MLNDNDKFKIARSNAKLTAYCMASASFLTSTFDTFPTKLAAMCLTYAGLFGRTNHYKGLSNRDCLAKYGMEYIAGSICFMLMIGDLKSDPLDPMTKLIQKSLLFSLALIYVVTASRYYPNELTLRQQQQFTHRH